MSANRTLKVGAHFRNLTNITKCERTQVKLLTLRAITNIRAITKHKFKKKSREKITLYFSEKERHAVAEE